jgi:hypothetical protein
MEYTVSHIFIITVPVIATILYLLSKGLLIILAICCLFFIPFFLLIYNSSNRKETLSIVKDNREIYFNLSDDLLFSVKLSKEESLSELIEKIMVREIITLKDMVDNIDFINFRDDRLHRELNRLVQN